MASLFRRLTPLRPAGARLMSGHSIEHAIGVLRPSHPPTHGLPSPHRTSALPLRAHLANGRSVDLSL